jgi:hypothetical protein
VGASSADRRNVALNVHENQFEEILEKQRLGPDLLTILASPQKDQYPRVAESLSKSHGDSRMVGA